MASAKVKKTCQGCGDEFEVYPYRAGSAKHCSKECEKRRVDLECEYCGDAFTVREYRQESARFCDRECRGKWRSENIVGEDHPRWVGDDIEVECVQCGEEFSVRPFRDDSRFCDWQCSANWKSDNLTGSDHPLWEEDFGLYPDDWDEIARDVRDRDNYNCQFCGISNQLSHMFYNKGLDVHHVVPRRESEDDSFGNLISLCTVCHMRVGEKIHRGE